MTEPVEDTPAAIVTLKALARPIIQLGSGAIIGSIIRSHVQPTKAIHKITIPVASFAIGGAVAGAAADHMDEVIDDGYELFKKVQAKINKTETDTTE